MKAISDLIPIPTDGAVSPKLQLLDSPCAVYENKGILLKVAQPKIHESLKNMSKLYVKIT